jgi:hypothetical protein
LIEREKSIKRISYRETNVDDLLCTKCSEWSLRLSLNQAKRWFEGSCPENVAMMEPLPGFYDGLKAV